MGMLVKTNQLDLFSPSEIDSATSRTPVLLMDVKALTKWKKQISAHQQQVRTKEPVLQGALFEVSAVHVDPDTIAPFELKP